MEDNQINIALVGHVDHGKSSILGRLLVETHSLPSGKLEQLKSYCENHSKDFEYAYLIDALEKEQAQGITIDAARYFIRSDGCKFLLIDTPGHLDFIKNMMTGSSTADIALLTIDAKEGIQENALRHLFLLSFLQIQRVIVLVNKMDRVDYSEAVFKELSTAISNTLQLHQIPLREILPLSAKKGDNFIASSPNMPWYAGPSLWAVLRSFSLPEKRLNTQLRMPLQDIYRFSKGGDTRRIYCGTITAGTLKKGDRILFSPSQKTGIVASIESEPIEPTAGCATGFTLEQPLFVERGELISHQESFSPLVGNRLKVRLFWIGSRPISEGAKYHFRIHTHKVGCTIEAILAVYDSATLAIRKEGPAQAYEIIECIIRTVKPVAFDIPPLFLDTTRFALVDALEMVAAGVVQENQGPPAS